MNWVGHGVWQALIDDLDVASGVTKPPAVSPQRREQRKQRAKSIYQQMGDLMAQPEASLLQVSRAPD